MFYELKQQPDDPIIALATKAKADPSPNVVDLGVGVFKDPQGRTPIMDAVRMAEPHRLEKENTRAYQGIIGDPVFNHRVTELILGAEHPALKEGRISTLQTIGGSAAVLMGGQLVREAMDEPLIWIGTPTWANHYPLLRTAGVKAKGFPYYDAKNSRILFDEMMSVLSGLPKGSVVLLHGCCHNPSGADLSHEQWHEVAGLMANSELVPFVDVAYQGFGTGLEEDAYSWRLLAEKVPEMIISYSCSKNFSLYRDRIGALLVISRDRASGQRTRSHMMSRSRATYSMPAAHGAFLVSEILGDTQLRASWQQELAAMRQRIDDMRAALVAAMSACGCGDRFKFIADQSGMFSFLGVSSEQVERLRDEFSIYMTASSRISIAGLTAANLDYVANSVAEVIAEGE